MACTGLGGALKSGLESCCGRRWLDVLGEFVSVTVTNHPRTLSPWRFDVKWIEKCWFICPYMLKIVGTLVRVSAFCSWCVGRATTASCLVGLQHCKSFCSSSGLESVPFQVFHYLRRGGGGTGMIASSSTFRPHPGRVIRDLFRLLDAVTALYGSTSLQQSSKGSCSLLVSGYNLRADCQWRTLVPPLNSGANAAPASVLALM